MDDIDKYIPVSRDFFNRIQTLIDGIEVDLDAPLPTTKDRLDRTPMSGWVRKISKEVSVPFGQEL